MTFAPVLALRTSSTILIFTVSRPVISEYNLTESTTTDPEPVTVDAVRLSPIELPVPIAPPVISASKASLRSLLSVKAPRFWVSIAPVIRSSVQPLTVKVPTCSELFLSRCIVPPLKTIALCVTSLLKLILPVYPLSPMFIVPVGVSASVIVPSKLIVLPCAARRVKVPSL